MKKTFFFIIFLFSFHAFAEKQTIEIWTSSENVAKAINKLTAPFEKKFNAIVKVTVLNKDLTTQFKTAALSKKGPDILCWAHDVVGE